MELPGNFSFDITGVRIGRHGNAVILDPSSQRPDTAKAVTFITLDDETAIANLVVWPKIFEKYQRTVLAAGMMAVKGRIQREGDVVHLVAHELADLSGELAGVGDQDSAFPLPHGRGDEFHHGRPTPRRRCARGTSTSEVCTSMRSG